MDGSAQMSQPPGRDSFPAGRRYQIVDQVSSVLLVLALIYWATFVSFVSPLAFRGQSEDFTTYYAAALALRQHASANIYDLSLLHQVATGRGCPGYFAGYLYPQTLAILLEPLTLLPCNLASGFWMLLNVALWLASALLLAGFPLSYLPTSLLLGIAGCGAVSSSYVSSRCPSLMRSFWGRPISSFSLDSPWFPGSSSATGPSWLVACWR